MAKFIPTEMDAKAAALWSLLDDIDTLDDAAKGDDAAYRTALSRVEQTGKRDE